MNDYPLSSGRRTEGDYAIYPNSLLFVAGDYPDKDLSISEEDLKAAAEEFTALAFNTEHDTHGAHKAVLDGITKHFGGLGGPRKVWIDPSDPATLRGEVAVPLWLDESLKTKSLSMEIDRASKRFTGAALTYTPRVSEAAMMSAFAMSRHNTPEGQATMQAIHDMSATGGAVCDRKNTASIQNTASMASAHEATAMQRVHDMTVQHGATCSSGDKPAYYSSRSYLSNRNSHSFSPANFAKGTTMSIVNKLKAFFSAAGVPDSDLETLTDADFTPTADFSDSPQAKAMQLQIDTLQAAQAAAFNASVTKDAELFADSEVRSGRAFPAEKTALVAAFTQAAQDDAAHPQVVTFSAGTETLTGSRVDALKALSSVRPPHGLVGEGIRGDSTVLYSQSETARTGTEKSLSPDDINKLLAYSPLGHSVLNGKK